MEYCKKFCLDFNVKKSKVMVIGGKSNDQFSPLLLNGQQLEFVDTYRYLGVDVCTGKSLNFSAVNMVRSFHRAANSILYSHVKPRNKVLLRLLYTNCVPILTYASAVRELSAADMHRCHVALNNAIRRIFSYAVWQSIRHLRIYYGYRCLYELFALSKSKFLANAQTSTNAIVQHLSSIP